MRTCPSSEAKALRPPHHPLPNSSLHIFDPPPLLLTVSDLSHSLSTLSSSKLYFTLLPLLSPLSSCQITSNKTGQWSLSARSQLCLYILNGRVCLNVQWTHNCLGVDLYLCVCVCVCVCARTCVCVCGGGLCVCLCAWVCTLSLLNGKKQQYNTQRSAWCEINERVDCFITTECRWSVYVCVIFVP